MGAPASESSLLLARPRIQASQGVFTHTSTRRRRSLSVTMGLLGLASLAAAAAPAATGTKPQVGSRPTVAAQQPEVVVARFDEPLDWTEAFRDRAVFTVCVPRLTVAPLPHMRPPSLHEPGPA